MKKKFFLIAAFFVALALLFTGCPGAGDDDKNKDKDKTDAGEIDLIEVFSDTKTTQEKATVTIDGSSVTFFRDSDEMWGELITPLWDASAYSGIKFEYKSTGNASIFIQDTNSIYIFGYDGSDGWGAIYAPEDWTELTIPFADLIRQDWFGDAKPFISSAIIKICFQIAKDATEAPKKFEIRNFEAY